ncbi:MAG: hotdog fold thioesterase [Gammaproteobacteria bacterium]|nr:hotdog fold thioesterase [Gammaproteobacteria bacterium]
MPFEAQDPRFAERIHASFARQRVMAHLGAELLEVRAGYCRIQLPCRPELTQQHGYIHAGIVGTIADSAGGYAGYTLMPPDSSVLTVEYKLNLLAPASGDRLVAEGHVVRAGRTLVICRADVLAQRGAEETVCATLLQTLMTMHGKPDRAS